MTLSATIRSLWEDGRVAVGRHVPDAREIDQAARELAELERAAQLDLPGPPPRLDLAAVRWSLLRFHAACRFLVYRDFTAEDVRQAFADPRPAAESPAVHYSVDLLFRFLPDLVRLARGAAADDPLVGELLRTANLWPLSSVGMEGVDPGPINGFVDDPTLRAIYVDRIIARQDVGRLGDPRVADAVRAALGAFPELAPALANQLETSLAEEPEA